MAESVRNDARSRRLYWTVQVILFSLVGILATLVIVTQVQVVREQVWAWLPEGGKWLLPIYAQEPGAEHSGHFYIYDPQLGWRNVPGFIATTLEEPLTINSKGLRDREYEWDKPAGKRRVLVLGDSFTWGYGVADDEIFTEVLEAKLAPGWQVINTGVSGWGTDQEYLYLVEEGFDYHPDLVVLAFYTFNDPREVVESDMYGLSKPVFLDTGLTPSNVPVPRPTQAKTGLTSTVDPFELVVAIIEAMSRRCAEHNCRLVVMKFGTFVDPSDEALLDLERRFETRFERLTGPYLDLDEAFAERGLRYRELVAGNKDNHWNAFGHRQVGVILHEFLKREGLLEPATGANGGSAGDVKKDNSAESRDSPEQGGSR